MPDVKKSLSRRLYWLRKQRGVEIADVSQKTGLVASSLSSYETGDVEPKLAALILLADYYEVTIDYLLGRSRILMEKPDVYWQKDEIPENICTFAQASTEGLYVPNYAPVVAYRIARYAKGYLVPLYRRSDLLPQKSKEECFHART